MIKRITASAATLLVALAGVVGLASSPALAATTYFYAQGSQTGLVADGAAMNLTVESPQVSSAHDGSSSHSLAEMAVSSADGKNRIEVGWRKPASGPTALFVFHWVNNVPMGYNLCTDQAATAMNAGDPIDASLVGTGVGPRFQILHSGTSWWIAFNLQWTCTFADSVWTSAGQTFNKVNTVQGYGEVASTLTATPCADMGDGQAASSGTAARIGSYNLQNQTAGAAPTFSVSTIPSTVGITTSVLSADTFRYGWAGYKDNPSPTADSLPGTVGVC